MTRRVGESSRGFGGSPDVNDSVCTPVRPDEKKRRLSELVM